MFMYMCTYADFIIVIIIRLLHSDKGNKMSGEPSEESEQDEESELMKQVMGFNKFDTTKVCVTTCRTLRAHPVHTMYCTLLVNK